MLATVKAFGWSNVAVVYTTDDYGTGGFRDIRQGAPNADICISTVVSFGRTEDNGTFQPQTSNLYAVYLGLISVRMITLLLMIEYL